MFLIHINARPKGVTVISGIPRRRIAAEGGNMTLVSETCSHHWVIEPANGPLSQGVCQICHEVRDFENYIEQPQKWIPTKVVNYDYGG